jgi:hypothetical protein
MVFLQESISVGGCIWPLALAAQNHISHHPGIARILDPDWVDLDIINKWKDFYFCSHGAAYNTHLGV